MTTAKYQSFVTIAIPVCSSSEVKRALSSILVSKGFCSSPQLSAFLTYVVEQTLDGRGSSLKAYSIATEALGRPAAFDPITDATVRVLAGRVRSALELYYSRLGPTSDTIIELLAGSYTPQFRTSVAPLEINSQSIQEDGSSNLRPIAFSQGGKSTIHPNNRATHRLLILDDNSEIRSILRRIGNDAGYFVVEAGQANEFWLAYHTLKPTHLILDLILPGADGLEIMRELGCMSAKCQIILLSGVEPRILRNAERLGRELGLNIAGATSKPFAVDALIALLEKSRTKTEHIGLEELSNAITSSDLELHYQPNISWDSAGNSSLNAVEGLVRWNHPIKGLLLPDKIILAAEEGGLTSRLTQCVIDLAISQLAQLNPTYPNLKISINLTASALDDLNFPNHLAIKMDLANLARDRLVLEIDESIASSEIYGPNDCIVRLGLKGFTLSMDNFGSSHSTLIRLLCMPFNELKIDKYFIQECTRSEEAKMIARTIIGLAHNLKIRSCAVGIENKETLQLLRDLGCNLAQGNFFSKPVPSIALVGMIEHCSAVHW